jgi:hypothetical protein
MSMNISKQQHNNGHIIEPKVPRITSTSEHNICKESPVHGVTGQSP